MIRIFEFRSLLTMKQPPPLGPSSSMVACGATGEAVPRKARHLREVPRLGQAQDEQELAQDVLGMPNKS